VKCKGCVEYTCALISTGYSVLNSIRQLHPLPDLRPQAGRGREKLEGKSKGEKPASRAKRLRRRGKQQDRPGTWSNVSLADRLVASKLPGHTNPSHAHRIRLCRLVVAWMWSLPLRSPAISPFCPLQHSFCHCSRPNIETCPRSHRRWRVTRTTRRVAFA